MVAFLCKVVWNLSESVGVRCPFAPWVFGRMIGAKSWRRIDK